MTALLLLIAVVIGYSTAWRYYKSLCIKRTKANELEIGELKSQIIKLKRLSISILRQISDFNDEDSTDIFEISPRRTGNDKWIDQSGLLAKKQLYHLMN